MSGQRQLELFIAVTARGRGIVVLVRATPTGNFVLGVEDADGEVTYFTEKGVRLAQS